MKCQILFSWKNKKHRRHFVTFVIIFPENRFYILCKLSPKYARNVKSFFLGKIRKNISKCKMPSAENFAQRAKR